MTLPCISWILTYYDKVTRSLLSFLVSSSNQRTIQGMFIYHHLIHICVIYNILYILRINLHSENQSISKAVLPGSRAQPWDIRMTTSVNNIYWSSLGALAKPWIQKTGHKRTFNRRNRTESMWFLEWAENPLVMFCCLFPIPENAKKTCVVSPLICEIKLALTFPQMKVWYYYEDLINSTKAYVCQIKINM